MKSKLIIFTSITALTLGALIPAYSASRSKSAAKTKVTESKNVASKKAPAKSNKADPKEEAKPTSNSTKLAAELTTTQKSKLLTFLNEGTAKELDAIDGVAKIRSLAIVEARPFKKVEDISVVKGIGKVTYAKIVTHGKSLTKRTETKPTAKS